LAVVGTSRSTPEFAVDAIEQWWLMEGQKNYRGAKELLILADSGGANGSRCKVWKCDIQSKLCNKYGLTVTVRHYPPGSSKWNPIEHMLFSQISRNWQGIPLETYKLMLRLISATTTKTGLTVISRLNRKEYETGKEVSKEEWDLLNISSLSEWSYTISPYTREHIAKAKRLL
jgi:hypothetical protein